MIVAFLFDFFSVTLHLKPKAKIFSSTDLSDSVLQKLCLRICPQHHKITNTIPESEYWGNISGIISLYLNFLFLHQGWWKNNIIKHFLFKIGKIYTCADSIVGDPWICIYLHHWWTGGRTFKTYKTFHSADNELISCKYCFAGAVFRGYTAT